MIVIRFRAAQLPLAPQSFASYDRVVARVAHIASAPSDMESTTHVFAWGHDVYYTMMRPARGFDTLQDDFSFALLTVALAALVIGTGVVRHLLVSAQLKAKWQ
jgi:ER membrane protein complex subunit 1